jgi:hypothetical protein
MRAILDADAKQPDRVEMLVRPGRDGNSASQ